jgi:ABC-2 type transport system ATP-binding protein
LKGADVFLLDEPTSGLDPESTAEFANVLQGLKSERKAILLSTHDVGNLPFLADRVGVLKNGRLVRECQVAELTRIPGSALING